MGAKESAERFFLQSSRDCTHGAGLRAGRDASPVNWFGQRAATAELDRLLGLRCGSQGASVAPPVDFVRRRPQSPLGAWLNAWLSNARRES